MTNHWIDVQHADVIMCIGSNPAENHPISFRWIEKAKDNGAKLISVDPRYTRTSSKSDIYAQLRPGTDIAFIGGLIYYALENDLIHREYVVNYTNASFLVSMKIIVSATACSPATIRKKQVTTTVPGHLSTRQGRQPAAR